jgi:hypothetical protein
LRPRLSVIAFWISSSEQIMRAETDGLWMLNVCGVLAARVGVDAALP